MIHIHIFRRITHNHAVEVYMKAFPVLLATLFGPIFVIAPMSLPLLAGYLVEYVFIYARNLIFGQFDLKIVHCQILPYLTKKRYNISASIVPPQPKISLSMIFDCSSNDFSIVTKRETIPVPAGSPRYRSSSCLFT